MVCSRFSADTLTGCISSTSGHMTFAAMPGSFQTSRPAPSIFPLAALADIPFGGIGVPTETGLYYAEIEIGTPSKAYYVQVDTGSDILWPNCICKHCPKKSDLGIKLILYDLKSSSSRSLVSCDESFCSSNIRW